MQIKRSHKKRQKNTYISSDKKINTNQKWKLYELYFIETLHEKSVEMNKKIKNIL